jgi:hypothetical protein
MGIAAGANTKHGANDPSLVVDDYDSQRTRRHTHPSLMPTAPKASSMRGPHARVSLRTRAPKDEFGRTIA